MSSINRVLSEDDGAHDIIERKIEDIDQWLLKVDSTRSDISIPRPVFDKIKELIEQSLRKDFNMIIEGYDFFD
jgi:hypothetical protein